MPHACAGDSSWVAPEVACSMRAAAAVLCAVPSNGGVRDPHQRPGIKPARHD